MNDFLLLGAGAFLAGLIDAVVGGGGLIQLPLLLAVMPEAGIPVLFGTNKLSSIAGTASAAWQYARKIQIPWDVARPASVAALFAAAAGAATVSFIPAAALRPMVLVLLLLVGSYVLFKPGFGQQKASIFPSVSRKRMAVLVGSVLGFYDGFFGPGTGSFLIFAFVRWFGMDMLHASATSKFVNLATNFAALLYFVSHEGVLWKVGLLMALANIAGAQVGARLAVRRGNGFVRILLLVVVTALLLKLGWDYWRS